VKFQNPIKAAIIFGSSLIWVINGLYCKILNLVPRHQLIVAEILGYEYAPMLTKLIGAGEVLVAIWVISNIKSRYCALFQMTIVAAMNVLEFILVPELLLFGRLNILFATLFIMVIYINEYRLKNREKNDVLAKQ
jgi:hypothetical protein